MPGKKNVFVLILLIPPILIAGIAFLSILIPLPSPFPQPGSQARNLPAALLTGILGLLWVIGITFYTINSFLSSRSEIESTMTAQGLKGRRYLLFGSMYTGEINGERVEVQFMPNRAPYHSLLNIWIGTHIKKHMSIGMKRPLEGCSDCKKVEIFPNPLGEFQAYAEDIAWAQNLLSDPEICGMILTLMNVPGRLEMREIYVQNGQCRLHVRPTQPLMEHELQLWLDTLLVFSKTIEKMN